MPRWITWAIAVCLTMGTTASLEAQDTLINRFRTECRARYAYLRGPGQRDTVVAHVRACVRARIEAAAHAAAVAPTASEKPIRLLESTPWLVRPNRGPAQAKGVIYFVAGYSPTRMLDGFHLVPYFLKSLADDGWDIVFAKLPQDRVGEVGYEYVGGGAQTIRRRVAELKAQGYKRVIAGGHSWGGWAALMAARDGAAADALLISGPNTFGSRIAVLNGRPNAKFNQVLTEFGPVLNKNLTPTVMILPDDHDWDPDPGARGKIAEAHFTQANIPHLVIAKPPGFSGHYAAWLPIFDYAYGACIIAFLDRPAADTPAAPCAPPPLANDDFRSIVALKQVAGADQKRIVSDAPLLGKKFVAYTLYDVDNKHFDYVAPGERVTMLSDGEIRERVAFRDGLQCIGKTCSILVRWSESEILEFEPKSGAVKAWWIEDK
jgi:hypothetical protein